ncbi:YrhK family protein [Halobacillus faecis]|uniref:YrhK domain-containing protein n=1 Tax=Halobacillus faecis TaxID=360184 RepID=A0A511WUF5_9BACI|nr:YrhK family protein [Halobacillus faecis]GEN54547.1 hypothetical protein HFA01_28090 [Halobacillus faecis]
MSKQKSNKQKYVDAHIKKHNLFSKKTYDILYTVNDILLGVTFLMGSVLFYFEPSRNWGVTLYILGSTQMILRPTLRLIHYFHMRKEYGDQYDQQHQS